MALYPRSDEESSSQKTQNSDWKKYSLIITGSGMALFIISIMEVSLPNWDGGIPWSLFLSLLAQGFIGLGLIFVGLIYGIMQFSKRRDMFPTTDLVDSIANSGKPIFQNTLYRDFGSIAVLVLVIGFLYTPLSSQKQVTPFVSIPIGIALSLVVFFDWTVYRFYNDRIEVSRHGRILQTIPYFDVIDSKVTYNIGVRTTSQSVSIRLREDEYSLDHHTNFGNITIQDLTNRKLHLYLSTWLNTKLGEVQAHENRIHAHNMLHLQSAPHLVVPIEEHRKKLREELRNQKRRNNEVTAVGAVAGILLVGGPLAIMLQGQPEPQVVHSLINYLITTAVSIPFVWGTIYLGWKLGEARHT